MKNKNFLMVALTLLLCFSGIAQNSSSIKNILDIKYLKKSGIITQDEKLVGYYLFYFKEKEDRKTSTYEVQFFDDNYNQVNSFEVTRPKNTILNETHFNGTAFLLFFSDSKSGNEYITYDKEGNTLGNMDNSLIGFLPNYQTSTTVSNTFNTTGNSGFVGSSMIKTNKVGYRLTKFDNEMNELWQHNSPSESKMIEQINVSQVNESIITATKNSRKSLMTKKFDTSFLIIDSETGELISEMKMGDKILGKQSILRSYIDPSNSKISIIGQYYNPGDDVLKDKSQGLFIREISKTGKILLTKKYNWKSDVAKFIANNQSSDQKKEAKLPFSIFFHEIIQSKNGHTFLIGEQFRKQVSALGVAGNVLAAASGNVSSNASNFEIRIGDMIVIELDERKTLVGYKVIEKKRNSVLLPEGSAFYSSAYLGYLIKYMGGFDYAFTSKDIDNDRFTTLYRDVNKKEEKGSKKSDVMLGVIDIKKGELTSERVPFNSDYKYFWINSAKPGNISITEYDKKEKTLHMRLEKISY